MPDEIQTSLSDPRAREQADKKIRLLVLTSHAIQYQAPFFRALARHPGVELMVVLCSKQGAENYKDEGFGRDVQWDIPLLEGYPYTVLPNWSPKPDPSTFLGLINPQIVRMIWRREHDALVLHAWSSVTNWMAILTAWFRGVPVILKTDSSSLSPSPVWKKRVKRIYLSWMFRRVSKVLAAGKYGREFFLQHGVPEEKIGLAPFSVDNDFFISQARELAPKRQQLTQELGLPTGIPIILYAGKLIPLKRPQDILRAFEIVSKADPCALVFVGDGPMRQELEEIVRSRTIRGVVFAGFQNQSDLPRYYAASDILVLASETETWGLVVNEAMCFSLPVIVSSRVGAGGDLVKQGENGFVFEAGDVNELTNFLSKLVKDKSLRQRMGMASFGIMEKWGYKENIEACVKCL